MRTPTHSSVFVFDFTRQLTLLVRKNRPEHLAGKWNPPGGKIESRETPLVAAIREVREETGISLVGAPRLFAVVDRSHAVFAAYAVMQPESVMREAAAVAPPTDEPLAVWGVEDTRLASAMFPDDFRWLLEMALPAAVMDFRQPMPVYEVRSI